MSIADVERDTGLGKDTLRVWERRYGFPRPRRDALGERVYPPAQVEKLRLIKRLMDAGHRPGRLVPRPLGELRALSDQARATPARGETHAAHIEAMVDLLRGHDAGALLDALGVGLARLGLRDFVIEWVAPLATRVGEGWMRGELRIYEEHLFTECAQSVLRAAIAGLPAAQGAPRVLLATLPGEPHGLGLLMAQAMLALHGCTCLSLGVQVPVADIAAAAIAWRADIVALSATGCMKRSLLLTSLALLRAELAAAQVVWLGGAAPGLAVRHLPEGVQRIGTLEAVAEAVQHWHAAAPRRA